MFKKILLILTTILCCMSCEDITRDTDKFVINGKELNEYKDAEYKYIYHVFKYEYYKKTNKYMVDELFLFSNEEYNLGDTLQLVNVTSQKKD